MEKRRESENGGSAEVQRGGNGPELIQETDTPLFPENKELSQRGQRRTGSVYGTSDLTTNTPALHPRHSQLYYGPKQSELNDTKPAYILSFQLGLGNMVKILYHNFQGQVVI